MNKAFNRKGKLSFDDAYPSARFEFRSLKFGKSKKKHAKEMDRFSNIYEQYRSKSYLTNKII